jgi:hypothetical protein
MQNIFYSPHHVEVVPALPHHPLRLAVQQAQREDAHGELLQPRQGVIRHGFPPASRVATCRSRHCCASKHGSIDDSQYGGPCNQSVDTRERVATLIAEGRRRRRDESARHRGGDSPTGCKAPAPRAPLSQPARRAGTSGGCQIGYMNTYWLSSINHKP